MLGADHTRCLAPPEGLPFEGRAGPPPAESSWRNDPPTRRFILGDERRSGPHQGGWRGETGVVPAKRPSSGGTTHGRPARERRIRWPPAHVTCTPSGSGPGTHGVARPPARRADRQDDGAWRIWQWLRAFDRRYAALVDLVLAAGAVRPLLGLGHRASRGAPQPLVRGGPDLPARLPAPGADDRLPLHCRGGVRPVARHRPRLWPMSRSSSRSTRWRSSPSGASSPRPR